MATHSSILAWRIPTERGAWQATVHRVAKSQTRQATSHMHTHTHTHMIHNCQIRLPRITILPCFFTRPPTPAMETHVEKDVYLDSETVNS